MRRAQHLRARERRLPDRALQGLLRRASTAYSLRRGPRLIQDASGGSGDSGIYRAPTDDRRADRGARAGATTRRSATATPTTTRPATPGPPATPCTSTTTSSTTTPSGFTTDVFTASGHRASRQDSILIENNDFYSNNFNPYVEGSDVEPDRAFPVGTGMWIAGGNNNTVRNNRFWDNWRRGTMVPRCPTRSCAPPGRSRAGRLRSPSQVSTSHRNRHHGNVMGIDQSGRRTPRAPTSGGMSSPGTEDCWYDNTGKEGTPGSMTSDPRTGEYCDTSRHGKPAHEAELRSRALRTTSSRVNACAWSRH